jgi:hypothetical protein
MSTYSPSLRIQLITTGDQAGVWGNTTNVNLGTLIESAIAGYTSVSVTSANQALTALDGLPDESRNMVLALTTTTTAAFAVYAPPAEKTYTIYNASLYAATIYNSSVLGNTTAAGAGVVIPAGKTMTIWSDGTNFALQNTHIIGTVVGNVTGNLTGNVTGNVSGTADNVTGVVAVANGGTGSSTANTAKVALNVITATTGSAVTPVGTTAQRDGSPATGFFRFNTTVTKFEGYNGTAWGSIGGGATGGGADEIFVENGQNVTVNYTIPGTKNAMSTGPITVDDGVSVTISSGSRWVVI